MLPKNSPRLEMVEKAKQISDFLVDTDSVDVTFPATIAHLAKYGCDRGRFPRDASTIATISNDKLAEFFKELTGDALRRNVDSVRKLAIDRVGGIFRGY